MKKLNSCPFCKKPFFSDTLPGTTFYRLNQTYTEKCLTCIFWQTIEKNTNIINNLMFRINGYQINIDFFSSLKGTRISKLDKRGNVMQPTIKLDEFEPDFNDLNKLKNQIRVRLLLG